MASKGERQSLRDSYREQKKQDPLLQTCPVCGERSPKLAMEPHHPNGRSGKALLQYFWVHPVCHRFIHDHPDIATERGWLIRGRNTNLNL